MKARVLNRIRDLREAGAPLKGANRALLEHRREGFAGAEVLVMDD